MGGGARGKSVLAKTSAGKEQEKTGLPFEGSAGVSAKALENAAVLDA